ncbi:MULTISPECIES: DUF1120 domain-containing protein [unclassified Pseudomonas]|uniref:DUF1120 domain-containing protein n=1 Tax=unclassified Pseudomonas TaxID=196821 RepID=UPI002AC9644A|nr:MULTISPECIES: DUF1120 domain-containing protein [unclassified Pseudomonas]MEB0047319.1 DUF1120 domain-containing protein [Pseudomonas sp. Dout3]MEB0096571.1 DUF1120 domain-containing protein [Pseudomonas sp. DC1.2]WPX60308.1 DUF1120 domain-containing protein [Pseudomonas sp. DC1.2]
MHVHTNLFLASLMLTSAGSVSAASTADLRVIGSVIPSACTPLFAGGGVVDYGHIPAGSLSATLHTALQTRNVSYSIICDAPIPIGISWVDDRLGSASIPGETAFGLDNQGANRIGLYTLRNAPRQMLGDGKSVDSITSFGYSGVWVLGSANGDYFGQGARNPIYSFAKQGNLTPTAYTTYSGAVSVTASIAPTTTLDMTAPLILNGLSTMVVHYL